MKRNLLAAIKVNTSPISENEFESFLIKFHGSVSRENASRDSSMLDTIARKSLEDNQRVIIKYSIINETKDKYGHMFFNIPLKK